MSVERELDYIVLLAKDDCTSANSSSFSPAYGSKPCRALDVLKVYTRFEVFQTLAALQIPKLRFRPTP